MAAWKWFVGLWMTAVILAAFLYAREAEGFVPGSSRIIFFHVPMAMLAVVGFLLAMIHAVRYLTTRDPLADIKSETAAELGLLFCALATITGSLFARVMWNSYWNWDPRETSILIQLFIYGAYFGLRMAVDDPERRATLSAVYAILAFVTVPFLIFVVPRVPALIGATDSMHPTKTLWEKEGLSVDYKIVLYSSFAGFCGLFAWFYQLQVRVRQATLHRDKWLEEGTTRSENSAAGTRRSGEKDLTRTELGARSPKLRRSVATMGHYYTLAVTLVVWAGLFFYLRRIDKKVSDLEEGER